MPLLDTSNTGRINGGAMMGLIQETLQCNARVRLESCQLPEARPLSRSHVVGQLSGGLQAPPAPAIVPRALPQSLQNLQQCHLCCAKLVIDQSMDLSLRLRYQAVLQFDTAIICSVCQASSFCLHIQLLVLNLCVKSWGHAGRQTRSLNRLASQYAEVELLHTVSHCR